MYEYVSDRHAKNIFDSLFGEKRSSAKFLASVFASHTQIVNCKPGSMNLSLPSLSWLGRTM